MKKAFLVFATALAYWLLTASVVAPFVQAGGPKCDRKDSAKCGMSGTCAGMKDGKKTGSSCSNACHRGCCGCPDGSEPTEGEACPRDTPQGNPEEQ